ncbi:NERD domain-containing protein [Sulfuriroseicoccus oceanibius]|uniref:ATP-binding domain-containing protein n=1 Tax=Sulfuriroseicoccus oceanibius TaxID=2707525 RepID=A0A6B3L6R1_9BACT|nr:NERD domain-containing protein [Sulfuriroseicoccus oceanibius]QQL43751.1 ATP-binding domain-containing protein [Sulfuriroseicoccus oceanibius]
MAKWILNRPKKHAYASEITVARYLKNLSDDWLIVWGFFYKDDQGTEREGDFLILAPIGGLLVLEVKGGTPRHFSPTGAWEGGDNDNPISQLDGEWGSVIRDIKGTALSHVFIAKALCYPDGDAAPDEERWHGLDRSRILTGNELKNGRLFMAAMQRFFSRGAKDGHLKTVDDDVRAAFLQLYGHGRDPEALREFLDHTEERFRQQIVADYRLLDLLRANQQLLVEGGPGCGKSWYALEQARRYAAKDMRVLFLVYNLAITEVMRNEVKRDPSLKDESGAPLISVMNYEEVAALILGEPIESLAPQQGAPRQETSTFYDVTLPSLVLEALRNPSRCAGLPKYDALVVDEGQDHDTELPPEVAKQFPEAACGWWSIYWRMLKHETLAPMAIFFDRAQRPAFRRANGFLPERIQGLLSQPALVTLDQSLRYTRPVYEFLQSLDGDGTSDLVAAMGDGRSLPEGPEVELYEAAMSTEDLHEQVASIIRKWEEEGYCQPRDVLILHARTDLESSALGPTEKIGSYPLRTEEINHQFAVGHNSIHKAKGLDSRAVILVDVQHPYKAMLGADDRSTLFMGASRARQLLAVVGETNEADQRN